MNNFKLTNTLLAVFLLLNFPLAIAENTNMTNTQSTINTTVPPAQMLDDTTNEIIAILNKEGKTLKNDPQRINQIVDDYVLPHFDSPTMAKLALGKNWRKANKAQKIAFINEFQNLLVRTYSKSMLEFKDQQINYTPPTLAPDTKKTAVKAVVIQDTGPAIPLVYRLRIKNNAWIIYDVKVDGVSLITSYRGTFTQEVRKSGIDGLIEYLHKINVKKDAVEAKLET